MKWVKMQNLTDHDEMKRRRPVERCMTDMVAKPCYIPLIINVRCE